MATSQLEYVGFRNNEATRDYLLFVRHGDGRYDEFVVAIEGNTVRLGISAPAEIGVYREELWRQIRGSDSDTAPARVGGATGGP